MDVLDLLQGCVCCPVEVVLDKEVDQLEEHLVTVDWLDALINSCDVLVIDDVYLEFDCHGSEVLRLVVLWLELFEVSHPLDS